ncbi:MAG: hypothetical protein AABW93_03725 [Nanoarchaeota archaeon]
MPTYNSGRAADIGGLNIRQRRASDLNGIRFADNRTAAPTSANDMVLYRVSNSLRFWDGTTEYNLLTSVSGSVGDLNGVYENGSSVTVDEGPIILTDATTGALDTLRITTSGAKSGDALEFLMTGASTGRAIHIDMDAAITANALFIDNGAGARTGSDILVTDDSTGTHSVIDINSSGSGASTGLDWTDSYTGSDAAFGVKLTLDADDGIDATALQIVRGAGIRTSPAIDINDGSTGSADLIDVDLTGVFTGDVFDFASTAAATGNVFFINLDNAVAMTALHVEGSGARTQPMVEIASDATGAVSLVDVTLSGAISGHVLEISMDTTSTGDVLNVDMNAAVGGRFLFLDAGGGARTANLVTVTYDSTGNLDLCEINDTNTGSGHLFDINVTGAGSGNVVDIVYGAALDTGDALSIDLGATATGAQAIVLTSGVMTRTTNLVEIAENGAASGNTIDVGIGAVTYTGNVLDINLGATATGGQAIVIASGAMARTVALIEVGDAGTSSGPTFDINHTGITTGIIFDIDATAATTGNVFDYATNSASTGTIFEVTLANAVGAILQNFTLSGVRTANAVVITHSASGAVDVFQIDDSGTSSGHVFDINSSGNSTGNVIDIVASAGKVAGHFLNMDLATDLAGNAINIAAAGVRTAPIINIANTASDGGTDDHVIFINQTGILDSNLIQLTFGTAASTGEAISISMGTNLAGSALVVNGTGVRTDDLIKIDDDSTGNSHIFDINVSGIYTGNVLDIAFSVAAATGEAIMLAMGTNVAGRAIAITSAGTGVSDEGNVLDITHTGILVAGADIVNITSSGAISSTSNALAIEPAAGDAGSYALYINAGGTCEGIKVDAGTVTLDESLSVGTTLAVTGATTLSSTLSYRNLTEVVTAANVLTAAESGSVFFLNSATEFATTLPAPAAGLHFTFVITAAPSGANYTVVTETATNIIYGSAEVNGASVPAVAEDSINFVSAAAAIGDWVSVWCDGTNWYVKGMGVAAGSITFTAV